MDLPLQCVFGIAALLIGVARVAESQCHIVLARCQWTTGRSTILSFSSEGLQLLQDLGDYGACEDCESGDLCGADAGLAGCGGSLKFVILVD